MKLLNKRELENNRLPMKKQKFMQLRWKRKDSEKKLEKQREKQLKERD